MPILDFLIANWGSVLVVLGIVASVIVLILRKEYALLDRVIYALVTEAEKQYGGGTGSLKLAAVINWLYPKLPLIVRIFVTPKQLQKLIERVLIKAKRRWKRNRRIGEYVRPKETNPE